MSDTSARLFVVAAPSGAGKTTLVKALVSRHPELHFSISYTTRKKRSNEANGVDYLFVGVDEFARLRAQGDLLESAEVFDNCTRISQVGSSLSNRSRAGLANPGSSRLSPLTEASRTVSAGSSSPAARPSRAVSPPRRSSASAARWRTIGSGSRSSASERTGAKPGSRRSASSLAAIERTNPSSSDSAASAIPAAPGPENGRPLVAIATNFWKLREGYPNIDEE